MTPRTHSVTRPAWNKLMEEQTLRYAPPDGYANCVTRSALSVIASDEDAHE